MTENLADIRARAIARGSRRPPSVPRQDKPDALHTWETAYGCVVRFGGMNVYYGRCKDCGDLVTTHRPEPGPWPRQCDPCRDAKAKAHADKARHRMAALRAKRYADRDKQYAERGWEPVKQGVRHSTTEPKECRWCMSTDCYCEVL